MAHKRLGQYFLQNESKLRKIADVLGASPGDVVVEIGPGRGELTKHLVATGARVIGIEKDTSLHPPGEVIYGDVREELSRVAGELGEVPYLLAGNIPYYLTGYLFRILGDLKHKPTRTVFTIQKEVAERITKTDKIGMNLLAASILRWADAEYVATIPRTMFSPVPKVDSGIILLRTKGADAVDDRGAYMRFIKILFKQPRKLAVSNLGAVYAKTNIVDAFRNLGIDLNVRPGNLSYKETLVLCGTLNRV